MLELTDVVKEYRVGQQCVRALDGISLSIAAGEFTSIIGPSGSGKSTLLHLLGALDSPDSGSITFQGAEIGGLSDDRQSEFRLHRVGFVFQFFNLLPTLTAWENVAIPKLLNGSGLRKAKPRALELLELVGLGDRAEHRPAELSGGQMQRVAVARALIMDPPLILADEPTGNLDSKTGAAILELLGSITRKGNSVVMVTHDMGAAHYCDRVITLRDGRIGSIVAGEHAGGRAAADGLDSGERHVITDVRGATDRQAVAGKGGTADGRGSADRLGKPDKRGSAERSARTDVHGATDGRAVAGGHRTADDNGSAVGLGTADSRRPEQPVAVNGHEAVTRG